MSNFRDPTFDEATRELFKITKAAIIEWLCRGGMFTLSMRNRKRTWRQCMRDHALAMMALSIAAGLCLGWLLKMIWSE